jgi:MATE family multidrug resistance protein
MKWHYRLKRWVASGLSLVSGGRRLRPNAAARRHGRFALLGMGARAADSFAGTTRELFQLAWPIAAGMLGETALGLVDTKLVGGLGAAPLGGVGMANVLLFLGYSIVFGLMRGVKVRAAYATGEGRHGDALRYAHAGLVCGAAAGVLIAIVAQDLTWVLELLKVEPDMLPYARDFLSARSLGAVGTCSVAALIQYRQGIGDTRTPMLIGLGGNLVNAVLAYGMIYGHFGLPALGVRGAGYGTAITELLELAVLLGLMVWQGKAKATAPPISLRQALGEVASLGVPTGIHFGLEISAFTTFTAILGSFGAVQMAAHQIALATIRASFLPGAALAEAASVLVARALSRKRLDEADRVALSSLSLGVGFMSLCGIVFALFGSAISRVFSADAEVIDVARRLLLVAGVFQTFDAVNMILRGALRGAKDVRWVAIVGTLVVWSAIPGAAFVLGRGLGWGAFGGWIGFVLETILGSILMGWRWYRGSWRSAFTRESDADTTAPVLSTVTAGG